MKVLAIYPAFDVSINEMAMVWKRVCSTRDVQCTVLTSMHDVLKGRASAHRSEQDGNLRVFRFMPSERTSREFLDIAAEASADVIYCAVAHNMDRARQVQAIHHAPIVLHTEYFLDDEVFLRRRDHLGLPFLRPLFSNRARHRLQTETDRILCSNPKEFSDPRIMKKYPTLSYLPWPVAGEATPRGRSERHTNQGAYIGSLSKGKGAGTLLAFFSMLLDHEAGFELRIVGPAIDAVGRKVTVELQERFPGRVHAQVHCLRQEALQLLSESLFVFSPGRRFGWGLMSDAWSTGTPIIAPAEHYELRDGSNCIVATSPERFLSAVRRLRDDPAAWNALSTGGEATIRGHAIGRVADILYEALTGVASRQ